MSIFAPHIFVYVSPSSVAQWQSNRLLTDRSLVQIQPGELRKPQIIDPEAFFVSSTQNFTVFEFKIMSISILVYCFIGLCYNKFHMLKRFICKIYVVTAFIYHWLFELLFNQKELVKLL